MKQDEIVKLASIAESNPRYSIEIRHARRESRYRVLGFIEVDINDQWLVHVEYQCKGTRKKFARTIDQFHNFTGIT